MIEMRGELRRELNLFKRALEKDSMNINQQPECSSRVALSWSGISRSFEKCPTLRGSIDKGMHGPSEHESCLKNAEESLFGR